MCAQYAPRNPYNSAWCVLKGCPRIVDADACGGEEVLRERAWPQPSKGLCSRYVKRSMSAWWKWMLSHSRVYIHSRQARTTICTAYMLRRSPAFEQSETYMAGFLHVLWCEIGLTVSCHYIVTKTQRVPLIVAYCGKDANNGMQRTQDGWLGIPCPSLVAHLIKSIGA